MKKILLILFAFVLTETAVAQIRELPQEKNLLSVYNFGAEKKFDAAKEAQNAEIIRRKNAPMRKFIGEMPELPVKEPTVFEGEEYKDFINQSIFPLQDQIRFWGKDVNISQNQCNADGMFAIYNLRTNGTKELDYDCVGYVHSACGPECFEDGAFFGYHQPEFTCVGGKIEEIFSEGEDVDTLEKQVCLDEKNKVLWQRERDDNYVFDYMNRLMYFQNRNMFISYFNNKVDKEFIYDKDEYKYYDVNKKEDFFHVKYERDSKGRIIKEFHFNHDKFPYYIFAAEYDGDKCVQITKYDGYSGNIEIYKFKQPIQQEEKNTQN